MRCCVSLPNDQLVELQIDPKQTGQSVLDKVLDKLGILEKDLFGLQYKGTRSEELWLNLRNRVCDHEFSGVHIMHNHSECRLSLRVKFFIEPHLVQQEQTKDLFYTQIKDVMSKGIISLIEPSCDEAKVARIVAAIAQAEHGDHTYHEIIQQFCPGVEPKQELIDQIGSEHAKLFSVQKVSARNFVLKEVSSLPGYGVEEFKTTNAQGTEVIFRVGPEGIVLHDHRTKIDRAIPYSQICLATHKEKQVQLELLDDRGEPQVEECFKLVSRKAAVALYRCITEMHSFYRCDTVCSNVHSQYSMNFKGTFVSFFTDNSDCGKRFIFDIQRTSREAYDYVRRKLYAKLSSPMGSPAHIWPHSPAALDNDENGNVERNENENSGDLTLEEKNAILQKQIKQLIQKHELMEESFLCCICMFHKVSIVLCPCGHMVCDLCSERIENCPQCRTVIDHFQKVFHNFGLDLEKMNKQEQTV